MNCTSVNNFKKNLDLHFRNNSIQISKLASFPVYWIVFLHHDSGWKRPQVQVQDTIAWTILSSPLYVPIICDSQCWRCATCSCLNIANDSICFISCHYFYRHYRIKNIIIEWSHSILPCLFIRVITTATSIFSLPNPPNKQCVLLTSAKLFGCWLNNQKDCLPIERSYPPTYGYRRYYRLWSAWIWFIWFILVPNPNNWVCKGW